MTWILSALRLGGIKDSEASSQQPTSAAWKLVPSQPCLFPSHRDHLQFMLVPSPLRLPPPGLISSREELFVPAIPWSQESLRMAGALGETTSAATRGYTGLPVFKQLNSCSCQATGKPQGWCHCACALCHSVPKFSHIHVKPHLNSIGFIKEMMSGTWTE